MTEALDAGHILDGLDLPLRGALAELAVLSEVDSTNAHLLRLPPDQRHAHAVIADAQHQGRGRRERGWHSPPGGNLYFSLGWNFPAGAPPLSTLPLAVAVCVARSLQRAGLEGAGIKWPNDILFGGRKLAGILVESQSTGSGPALAVVGVGLNVRMPPGAGAAAIDRPWTDLASCWPAGSPVPGRNRLAALLLAELLPGLARFAAEGFAPFAQAYAGLDLLRGRRVRLEGNGSLHAGTALALDDSGGLLVDIDGYGPQVLHAAEVRLFDE